MDSSPEEHGDDDPQNVADTEPEPTFSVQLDLHLKTRRQRVTAPMAVSFQAMVRGALEATTLEVTDFQGVRVQRTCGRWRHHTNMDITFSLKGPYGETEKLREAFSQGIMEMYQRYRVPLKSNFDLARTSDAPMTGLILIPFIAEAIVEGRKSEA